MSKYHVPDQNLDNRAIEAKTASANFPSTPDMSSRPHSIHDSPQADPLIRNSLQENRALLADRDFTAMELAC